MLRTGKTSISDQKHTARSGCDSNEIVRRALLLGSEVWAFMIELLVRHCPFEYGHSSLVNRRHLGIIDESRVRLVVELNNDVIPLKPPRTGMQFIDRVEEA